MKTKLVVVGAAGRMGRRIIALAVESGKLKIVPAYYNLETGLVEFLNNH